MNRRSLLKQIALSGSSFLLADYLIASQRLQNSAGRSVGGSDDEKFKPTWESLKQFETPEWFRDAKFGIWAHWGPQCQAEAGDWYAREMYMEGTGKYNYHLSKFGHPSVFGFKDVINKWKAEKWNPDELVALYKDAGAKYFMALANHHDNFDLYKSKHHRWNSVNLGPKKDLIAGWQEAARKNGLYFGASVHAAHAWSWYETAQRSDQTGPKKGIPYDGKLTAKDGKGTWWQGYDPQELYAQNHPLSQNSLDNRMIHKQWEWGNGCTPPSAEYCEKFLQRTIDLIDSYEPDLLYFDDTALPLWPVSDVGLKIAAHMYNKSIFRKGSMQAVVTGKVLTPEQQQCMVWDIERGQSNKIEPLPWQTDTCIGNWHYDRSLFDRHGYKTSRTVIHTLADVVSKNGNLMLNVPVRGDGSIDADERKIVTEVGKWMKLHSEAIYATRPWKVYGEGPASGTEAPIAAQGFNEGKGKPFTGEDIRFTTKGDFLYAIALGKPTENKLLIKSLAEGSAHYPEKIGHVELVAGRKPLEHKRTNDGLTVTIPADIDTEIGYAVRILP